MIKEFYIKYKIFIIPSAVGLVCLIIIVFVIIPQITGLFAERDKVGVLTNKIELLNNKAKELEGLDETILKQDLVTALTILPTERDVPQAMAALQDIITKSNVSLKSTSYSVASRESGQDSFSLTISIIGSLASTRDFMNNLREGSRIFKIESISSKIQTDNSLVSTDLPLTVFYQPAPATVLTLDQPVAKIGPKEEELIKNLTKYTFKEPVIATVSSASSSVPIGKPDPFQ